MKHKANYVGDLLQSQPEDFRLAQEVVTDWAKLAREKIEREEASFEFEETNQGRLL